MGGFLTVELNTLKALSEPVIQHCFFIGTFLTNPMIFRWGNEVDYYRMDTVIGYRDEAGFRDTLRIVKVSLTAALPLLGNGGSLYGSLVVDSVTTSPGLQLLSSPQYTNFMAQDGRSIYIPRYTYCISSLSYVSVL